MVCDLRGVILHVFTEVIGKSWYIWSFTEALSLSVSSLFTMIYQKTNRCQVILIFLYYPDKAIAGAQRAGETHLDESFMNSYLLLCIVSCQSEACTWSFLAQAYIEEHENAMVFFCLFVYIFFSFFSILAAKFVCQWASFILNELLTSSQIFWNVVLLCGNGVLMTLSGEMSQICLPYIEPDFFLSGVSMPTCIKQQLSVDCQEEHTAEIGISLHVICSKNVNVQVISIL